MLKNSKNILAGISLSMLIVGASACTAFAASNTEFPATSEALINSGPGNPGTSILDVPASDLTTEEADALLFMIEEEKLARDVYSALYNTWGQPVFQNIAASEQTHMDAVEVLIDRYNLANPTLAPGSFSDENLQALYNQLIAQGTVSLAKALQVGGAIEEIDILDLDKRIVQIDNIDIQQVFSKLLQGSHKHLNAFARLFSMQAGETYQPQYLRPEVYAAIITEQDENGFGNRQQAGGPGRAGARRWSSEPTYQ